MDLFPKYEHKIFIATPANNLDFSFDYEEIPRLKERYPELFSEYFPINKCSLFQGRRHRCQGGVTNGVLTVDGVMKICPLAEEDGFIIGNTIDSSLTAIWNNPNDASKNLEGNISGKHTNAKNVKKNTAVELKIAG